MKKIRVAELFAGVGGFRIGLEGWRSRSACSNYCKTIASNFQVVWSNQWEPNARVQYASMIYEARFGSAGHRNEDLNLIDVRDIPDYDMLVGGFPCQDYSVASTLKNAKGMAGKRGKLWWTIHNLLQQRDKKPGYLFFENVERLLISPAGNRGMDFATILHSLQQLGYIVEWRVINAADYGMPQRRRRVFILGYHTDTNLHRHIAGMPPMNWLMRSGPFPNAFPVVDERRNGRTFDLSDSFFNFRSSPTKKTSIHSFANTGILIAGKVTTLRTVPDYYGPFSVLENVLETTVADEGLFLETSLDRWRYLKGRKKELRRSPAGFEYYYSEGAITFPDRVDHPSRTIVTSEGGAGPSRTKHVIEVSGRYRRLSPVELERLNMFPDNHTRLDGVTASRRAFCMGNALVIGVIEKIRTALSKIMDS